MRSGNEKQRGAKISDELAIDEGQTDKESESGMTMLSTEKSQQRRRCPRDESTRCRAFISIPGNLKQAAGGCSGLMVRASDSRSE